MKKIIVSLLLISFAFVSSIQIVNADNMIDQVYGGGLGGGTMGANAPRPTLTTIVAPSSNGNNQNFKGDSGSCNPFEYCGPSSYGIVFRLIRYGQSTGMQTQNVGSPLFWHEAGFFIGTQEIEYISAIDAPIKKDNVSEGAIDLINEYKRKTGRNQFAESNCSPIHFSGNVEYEMSSATFTSNISRNGNYVSFGNIGIDFKEINVISDVRTQVCTTVKTGIKIVSGQNQQSQIDYSNSYNNSNNSNSNNTGSGRSQLVESTCEETITFDTPGGQQTITIEHPCYISNNPNNGRNSGRGQGSRVNPYNPPATVNQGEYVKTICRITELENIYDVTNYIAHDLIAFKDGNKTVFENLSNVFGASIDQANLSEYYIEAELVRAHGTNGHRDALIKGVGTKEQTWEAPGFQSRMETKYTCSTSGAVVYSGDRTPSASECEDVYGWVESDGHYATRDESCSGTCGPASPKGSYESCEPSTSDKGSYWCHVYGCQLKERGVWNTQEVERCKGTKFQYTKVLNNDHGVGDIIAEFQRKKGLSYTASLNDFAGNLYNYMESSNPCGINNCNGAGEVFLGPDVDLALVSSRGTPNDFVDLSNLDRDTTKVLFGVGMFWPMGFQQADGGGCQNTCSKYLNGITINENTKYSDIPKEYIGCAENYCENLARQNGGFENAQQKLKKECMASESYLMYKKLCKIPYPEKECDVEEECSNEINKTSCSKDNNSVDIKNKSAWCYIENKDTIRDQSTFLNISCTEDVSVEFKSQRAYKLVPGSSITYGFNVKGNKKCTLTFDTEKFEFEYNATPRYMTTTDTNGNIIYLRKLMENLIKAYNSLTETNPTFKYFGSTMSTIAGYDEISISVDNLKYVFAENGITSYLPESLDRLSNARVEIKESRLDNKLLKSAPNTDEYKLVSTSSVGPTMGAYDTGETTVSRVNGRLLTNGCASGIDCGCDYANPNATNCYIYNNNTGDTFFLGDTSLSTKIYETSSVNSRVYELEDKKYDVIQSRTDINGDNNPYACHYLETNAAIEIPVNQNNIPKGPTVQKLCEPARFEDICKSVVVADSTESSVVSKNNNITQLNYKCATSYCNININGVQYNGTPMVVLTTEGLEVELKSKAEPYNSFSTKMIKSDIRKVSRKNTTFDPTSISNGLKNTKLSYSSGDLEGISNGKYAELYFAGGVEYEITGSPEKVTTTCTATVILAPPDGTCSVSPEVSGNKMKLNITINSNSNVSNVFVNEETNQIGGYHEAGTYTIPYEIPINMTQGYEGGKVFVITETGAFTCPYPGSCERKTCEKVLTESERLDNNKIDKNFCQLIDPCTGETYADGFGGTEKCIESCQTVCPVVNCNKDNLDDFNTVRNFCEAKSPNTATNPDAYANCLQKCYPCDGPAYIYRSIHNYDPFPDNKYETKLGKREIGQNWLGKEHYITDDDNDRTSVTGKYANQMVEYVIDITPSDIRKIRNNTSGGEYGDRVKYSDDNNMNKDDESKVYVSSFVRVNDENHFAYLFYRGNDVNGVAVAPFKEVVNK